MTNYRNHFRIDIIVNDYKYRIKSTFSCVFKSRYE